MPWATALGVMELAGTIRLGILNLTPDSFSDGGRFQTSDAALAQARRLIAHGADCLDLGAESTRPGAEPVDPSLEWDRLAPALSSIRERFPKLPLSVDTRHANVALRALARGVAIINDVEGFRHPGMLNLAKKSACGLIAMRSRAHEDGPLFMPSYDAEGSRDAETVIAEMLEIRDRLLGAGIAPERILLDPGFGFGTTFREDLALWESLADLPDRLAWPIERICIGISRKRFVAWRAGRLELPPQERDELSAAMEQEAEGLGYRVFRTHAPPPCLVRPVKPEDAKAVGALHVANWRETYLGVLPRTYLESLDPGHIEQICANTQDEAHPSMIRVLERRGQILGYAAAGPPRNKDLAKAAELYAIYLAPSVRRLGLGRCLLDSMLASLKADGCETVVLWVLERNQDARQFYESGAWIHDGMRQVDWEGGMALPELRYRINICSGGTARSR